MRIPTALVLLAALAARVSAAQPSAPDAACVPPAVPREFRAAWLVTVNNGDWPSKPGLSTWEQQRELVALIDRAATLGLNAIVFHVRTGGDAFYDSPYEPWSQFLTGVEGRAPEPAWDPLAFAVEKAHERGLELHAWFNPYRAHYTRDTTGAARTHVVRTNPELVRRYDRFIWMDPGEREVRRRAMRAVLDVVKRYDVDGVHIDDYFYPYPVNDSAGAAVDFPDSATYARYVKAGGELVKDDWRRHNVDQFVEEFYEGVKRLKPWVKVGVSPFGIWRPGNPPTIKGFDAYDRLYADSRKWLERGWLDYLAPQLYWAIDPPEQSYPVLLDWWIAHNPRGRHLWVGNYTGRVGAPGRVSWKSDEIVRQVQLTRERAGATGNIHFPMNVFVRDPDSLDAKLAALYAEPALVPASPWLGKRAPGRPHATLRADPATDDRTLRLASGDGAAPWQWVVRERVGGTWTTSLLPAPTHTHRLAGGDVVRVSAVSRTGVEGPVAVLVADRSSGGACAK
jgi:uncharacterized lipoprotein YddW (UPF0748 family)